MIEGWSSNLIAYDEPGLICLTSQSTCLLATTGVLDYVKISSCSSLPLPLPGPISDLEVVVTDHPSIQGFTCLVGW